MRRCRCRRRGTGAAARTCAGRVSPLGHVHVDEPVDEPDDEDDRDENDEQAPEQSCNALEQPAEAGEDPAGEPEQAGADQQGNCSEHDEFDDFLDGPFHVRSITEATFRTGTVSKVECERTQAGKNGSWRRLSRPTEGRSAWPHPRWHPGELVRADLASRSGVQQGAVTEVLEASPDRVEATAHPGLDLDHISYPRQLQLKREVVIDALERALPREAELPEVAAVVPSPPG